MKALLIINQEQYGYQTDYFQYVAHLKFEFSITYLCWDYNLPKIQEAVARIIYVPRNGNVVARNLEFIKAIVGCINKQHFHYVFAHYFRGIATLRLLCRKRIDQFHVDVRTGSVSSSAINRLMYNQLLRLEISRFKSKSVITAGLRDKLKLGECILLPLGATPRYVTKSPTCDLALLYIGTLTNRHIDESICGFSMFLNRNPSINALYYIVGGNSDEVTQLRRVVEKLGVQQHVKLPGYVAHADLDKFFRLSHIGISYVPITSYFDDQPPTKTYEYLMAGLPVIATNTKENAKIITDKNGIIVNDTAEAFAAGLNIFAKKRDTFNESEIRESVKGNEWSQIVDQLKATLFTR